MRTKVDLCGVDTAKLPVLKHEEMRQLFIQLQSGQEEVRDQLVMGNLRLVLSIVGRFAYRGEQADDLFQVGCIGLLKSIDHFDLSHNVRFSTYAVPMIIGEIRRHLRDITHCVLLVHCVILPIRQCRLKSSLSMSNYVNQRYLI